MINILEYISINIDENMINKVLLDKNNFSFISNKIKKINKKYNSEIISKLIMLSNLQIKKILNHSELKSKEKLLKIVLEVINNDIELTIRLIHIINNIYKKVFIEDELCMKNYESEINNIKLSYQNQKIYAYNIYLFSHENDTNDFYKFMNIININQNLNEINIFDKYKKYEEINSLFSEEINDNNKALIYEKLIKLNKNEFSRPFVYMYKNKNFNAIIQLLSIYSPKINEKKLEKNIKKIIINKINNKHSEDLLKNYFFK